MTTIAIMPERPQSSPPHFRAVSGQKQAVGGSVGQALDALSAQLGETESTTLVVVQPFRPDEFFSDAEQKRLEELMARWRSARDSQTQLPANEQAELDALVDAELRAAAQRAAALVRGLGA